MFLTLEGAPAAVTLTLGCMMCELVVAPTEITSGALEGELMVLKLG